MEALVPTPPAVLPRRRGRPSHQESPEEWARNVTLAIGVKVWNVPIPEAASRYGLSERSVRRRVKQAENGDDPVAEILRDVAKP